MAKSRWLSPLDPIFGDTRKRGALAVGNTDSVTPVRETDGTVSLTLEAEGDVVAASEPSWVHLWDFELSPITMSGARVATVEDLIAGMILTDNGLGSNTLSTINGVPAWFNNAWPLNDHRLNMNGILPAPISAPVTVVAVATFDGSGGFTAPTLFGASSATGGDPGESAISILTDNTTLTWRTGGGVLCSTTIVPGDPYVIWAERDGSASRLWLNGTLVDTGGGDGRNMQSKFFLGNSCQAGNFQSLDGKVGLLGVIGNAFESAAVRDAWIAGQMTRYGI